jgi:hypothetical protein
MIGRNSKEVLWKINYDRDEKPLDVKMKVQEHKLHYHEVGIECDGLALLAGAGSAVAKMKQDFSFTWPFRGNVFGVNEVNFFEMRPAYLPGDTWWPATITKANLNGTFQVKVMEPDGLGGFRTQPYPAIERENLRMASNHKPLEVPRKELTIFVPMKDPMSAILTLDDGSAMTQKFGRLSPSPTAAEKRQLNVTVAKDRSSVKANVGHAEMFHFKTGEVRTVANDVQRLSRTWTFQLGPFAQHTVDISKKYPTGSVITLSVDSEVFVEAAASEIGCKGGDWRCMFDFFGEKAINFEVYKTNKDGQPTDQTGTVTERRKYKHTCSVVIPSTMDFTKAQLFIDDRPFNQHQPALGKHAEPNLEMTPHAMQSTYEIVVPYKVDPLAPSNITLFTAGISDAVKGAATNFSWFAMCCGKQDNLEKHEAIETDPVTAPGLNF